jgi:hypothetical protein
MVNQTHILDQIAAYAIDGVKAAKPGTRNIPKDIAAKIREILPDVDEETMGAVIMVFCSAAADLVNDGLGSHGVVNLGAWIGSHMYLGKEI